MSNGSITFYKLIVLYTLSRVKAPLPSSIIFDCASTHGYTNYFALQEALGELLEADMIEEEQVYNLDSYKITDLGLETHSQFGSKLSPQIQDEINCYLKDNKYEILDITSFVSDYQRTSSGTYLASCTLREGNRTLFHLDIEVVTEDEAIKVCKNWQSHSETIYQTAIKNLLS